MSRAHGLWPFSFAPEALVPGTRFLDISQRKAARPKIEEQREALHQSEKLTALGPLRAGVAQALNNPLPVVVGGAGPRASSRPASHGHRPDLPGAPRPAPFEKSQRTGAMRSVPLAPTEMRITPVLKEFREFRPTKTATFWLCAASVVATLIIGFGSGGLVTSGNAAAAVRQASHDTYKELAAAVCAERFKNSPDASATLARLKQESLYRRDDIINAGGWAVMPGEDGPVRGVAEACAARLARLDSIPVSMTTAERAAAESPNDRSMVVQ